MVRLPVLSKPVNKLDVFALKELISELLCRNFSTGEFKGKVLSKPLWWPSEANWPYTQCHTKDAMVKVVESCYQFHDLDRLLEGPSSTSPEPSHSTRLKIREERLRRHRASSRRAEMLTEPLAAKENLENSPQYPSMIESRMGEERPYRSPRNVLGQDMPQSAVICDKDEDASSILKYHQQNKLLPQRLSAKARSRASPWANGSPNRRPSVKAQLTSKLDFVASLGLVTKSQAASLRRERQRSECAPELELSHEEPLLGSLSHPPPASPTRQPSLISQLSREAASPLTRPRVTLSEEDSDSDSHISDELSPDEVKLSTSNRLFHIDLCSELGARVRGHLIGLVKRQVTCSGYSSTRSDDSEEVEGPLAYEQFCLTPRKTPAAAAQREKLRDRIPGGIFPICFRKRPPKYTHVYCFNRAQRQEHQSVLRTGLSRRARRLQRCLRPCSIRLSHLTSDVIQQWRHRPQPSQPVWTAGSQEKDDDVISISSDEGISSGCSSSSYAPDHHKTHASPSAASKRPSPSSKPAAMLFRCHLCNAALTCRNDARAVIQAHFANMHKVFNIDLIEHTDARGHRVMSIVEITTHLPARPPQPRPQPQRSSLWGASSQPVVDLTLDDDDEVSLVPSPAPKAPNGRQRPAPHGMARSLASRQLFANSHSSTGRH